MVSPHEFACSHYTPARRRGTRHSPIVVVIAVCTHEAGVERGEERESGLLQKEWR